MKLIYVYDALCGWCFGFSPTIERFAQVYQADFEKIEVISGGMVVGNRIGPIGEVAGYISQAYKDVERATGIKFGEQFLNGTLAEGTAIFSSIPPAIALSIFKSYQPDNQLTFAARLQKAIYFEGKAPEEVAAYSLIAAEFGLDSDDFLVKMKDAHFKALAEEDFAYTQQLQVNGFPTVFVQLGTQYYPIARGAVNYKTLERSYQILKQNELILKNKLEK